MSLSSSNFNKTDHGSVHLVLILDLATPRGIELLGTINLGQFAQEFTSHYIMRGFPVKSRIAAATSKNEHHYSCVITANFAIDL